MSFAFLFFDYPIHSKSIVLLLQFHKNSIILLTEWSRGNKLLLLLIPVFRVKLFF